MRQGKGFTLIELVVTLAVIVILAAIGYPSYRDHVRRTQLTEAFASLSDFRLRMEQYFQNNRTYADAGNCGGALPNPENPKFTYECLTDGTTYTATATGSGGAVNGFVFTVNQRNMRATAGMHEDWGALPADAGNRWIDRKP
jgi:type IV pilus assembly protein PilE